MKNASSILWKKVKGLFGLPNRINQTEIKFWHIRVNIIEVWLFELMENIANKNELFAKAVTYLEANFLILGKICHLK